MRFPTPLIPATLVRRYKRFLADVLLPDGTAATAHVANSGTMLGIDAPGSPVWLSRSPNPARKLPYTLELVEADGTLVGCNTAHPNRIVAEAIVAGTVPALAGYATLRREVKYGRNSRIDILLEDPVRGSAYVEVKNVHLRRQDRLAEFPDCVTSRGAKHLEELAAMVAAGHRAVMVYLVQRADCDTFRIAADIDPAYAAGLRVALDRGVEALVLGCALTPDGIAIDRTLRLLA
ncbi:DNA/RNA nuclease SfsA [Rhodocista pekingensis]|uniref:Sugar fermentation stimulation protein homolog n=1 Tax=Rhodocista pekingensis TaxID=201185 RepID=A0ABW2KUY9_9PROT